MSEFFVSAAYAATQPAPASNGGAPLALLVLAVAILAWLGLRGLVSNLRARKTEAAVHGRFADYALEVLVNAAKIDRRVNDAERAAILTAMREIAGAAFTGENVASAFASAKLSKDELVAYLHLKAGSFTQSEKVALLKALLSVFVADGVFDESEHAALIDYTAAVGFDRAGAPGQLRGLARDFTRGNIT
jgi:uncharacterized membrane protein YebE (DUF533 family)